MSVFRDFADFLNGGYERPVVASVSIETSFQLMEVDEPPHNCLVIKARDDIEPSTLDEAGLLGNDGVQRIEEAVLHFAEMQKFKFPVHTVRVVGR